MTASVIDISVARVCRKRFAFVSLDACMGSQLVTMHVLRQLQVSQLLARATNAQGITMSELERHDKCWCSSDALCEHAARC